MKASRRESWRGSGGERIDAATQSWVRNESDRKAVTAGCRFDPERGAFAVFWIERFCRLYEGEANAPLILRGCHQCGTYGLPAATEFDDWEEAKPTCLQRAERFAACVAAGHPIDWQYECTMRLFSWVRHSAKWGREIRRFRQGSIWVAKKNKKSPTLAAWGFYIMAGDGEPGQKVFFAAKDGTQARKIVGEHTQQMLTRSADLDAECKLNLSTLRITHLPTTSFMEPLSSSNNRTQESKEGLNGSVLIDETHVVDRDFVRRLSRAGISRSEPLQIEVSTAGNNPDGYGKERFDYAQQVECGAAENQELFTAIYAAPQDLTDADLEANPLKFGRRANPAMGHTVDPEEFLQDYTTSKRSLPALLDFKMYRLNIWQRASNPWLKASDWARCRQEFTEADLASRECWAGLDLARSKAMCALVLAFPSEDEAVALLPYFWLPEERAKEIEQAVPEIWAWEKAGYITLTSGGVTNYAEIKREFRRLHQLFRIQQLIYDPRFAEELTQQLEQGQVDELGKVTEEGTGVPRVVFAQNDANFGAPTEDWERLVIAGKLHHNGHPVLAWQAGHAHVLPPKLNRVKRVVPPTRQSGEVRTVDGIIAGIEALAGAMKGQADNWWTVDMLRN